jgi:hypothetical protein
MSFDRRVSVRFDRRRILFLHKPASASRHTCIIVTKPTVGRVFFLRFCRFQTGKLNSRSSMR